MELWLAASTLVAAARLFRFIDRDAVDILFWDQWDFWGGLFDGADPWTMYRWQHGPQRQGLGGLVVAATARLSGWNARADVFVAGTIMLLAAIAALFLARSLRGRWNATDAILPWMVLSLSQYDLFAVTPNPAHGPLPLALVLLFALALQVRRRRLRLLLLAGTAFALTQTGFGMFFGLVALAFFAVLLADAWRTRTDVALHAAALLVPAISLLLYFHGFVFLPAVACFRFPDPHPARYFTFLAALFVRPFELPSHTVFAQAFGGALALSCIVLAARGAFCTVATSGRSRLAATVFALAGYSILFALNAAVGRVCLGPRSAGASRYVPYVVPFFVAGYLVLTTAQRAPRWRAALVAAFCALWVGKELLGMGPSLAEASKYTRGKRQFRDCYLATADVAACSSEFPIYPYPRATHLDEKLRFLRDRHLSFFRR